VKLTYSINPVLERQLSVCVISVLFTVENNQNIVQPALKPLLSFVASVIILMLMLRVYISEYDLKIQLLLLLSFPKHFY